MSNPIYEMMNKSGNQASLLQQLQQFKSSFHGDARAQVQQMLNSGRITQAQYDRAVQMANQIAGMMKY